MKRFLASASALVPTLRLGEPKAPVADLGLRQITGHLTFTAGTVTAWYTLPERVWAFQPDGDREAWMTAVAGQYAGLAGCRLHLRRTTRPYPTGQWAATLLRQSRPAHWPDLARHLQDATRFLDAAAPVEGLTLLGVTIPRAEVGGALLDLVKARLGGGERRDDQERLAERVAAITDTLTPWGLHAQPATPTELAWMIYRSVGLGLTPPDRQVTSAGPEDLLAMTDWVDRYRTRYASTIRVVNRHTAEECHVAVLTVGRMEPLTIPQQHQPWLHLADELPFPVEISSRVEVLSPARAAGRLNKRLLVIRSQERDYREHGLDAPPNLARLAERALTIGDEIDAGQPVDATRVHGWHRLAVAGRTEREALDRAAELRRLYDQQARIAVEHPRDQDRLAREFIPGEPNANTGYLREMPVKVFAAAVPQAVGSVGDSRGDLIGFTAGAGQRPVMWDAHFPMEVRERSGLTVFVAEPGAGKSTLMGAVGYLAARRGVRVTLLDPSGPLAALAAMPQLAGAARVLDLTGSGQGTLAPYALIPTPRQVDHTDPKGFENALKAARAERRMLALDIAMMLLPPQVAVTAEAATELRNAIREVPAEEDATLDDVAEVLCDGEPAAKNIGALLWDAAELPMAELLFGTPPGGVLDDHTPLTVITMGGLRLPDMSVDRRHWSVEEQMALPMLHLANRLAVRRCYGGDRHIRKLVGLDEAHLLDGWSSGRSFLVRLARDSRKWNIAALVASQNPQDILSLDVQNLVSTVFVGRVAQDEQVAVEALRLLRLPADSGYEQTLAGLSQAAAGNERSGFREFVMRDVDGRVQKIRVDVSYAAGLMAALDTTPTGGAA